jgi:hypothetical protein
MMTSLSAVHAAQFKQSGRMLSLKSSVSLRVEPPVLSPIALYGAVGSVVRKLEPHTEAHPAALLIQYLVALGNVIGRGPYFITEWDRHYPNLFAAIVGDSSIGKKGTSWGRVMSLMKEIDRDWSSSNIVSGLGSGEAVIDKLKDTDDPIAAAFTDKRLLLMEGEFAQVLQVMSRTGSTVSSIIRQAWDTGSLSNLTKGNHMKATDAHMSILAHITKSELKRLMSSVDAANGFSNRFLWCFSSRTKLLPDGGNIHPDEFYDEISEIRRCINAIQEAGSFQVQRNDEASTYWHEIYPDLTSARSGRWGTSTSRGAPQVVRLSLIFCLLDGKKTIELPHLKAAKAVWDYCCASARWAFEEFQFSANANKLIAALSHESMTIAETSHKVFLRNLSRMEINDVIDEIESVLEPPRLTTLEEFQKEAEQKKKDREMHEILSRL